MKDKKGFTLVELIIVIAIMGILATVAAFSWNMYTTNANLRTAARDVASDFFVTRQKAVAEGVSYRITFNVGANNYTITNMSTAASQIKTPASFARDIALHDVSFAFGGGNVDFDARGTVSAGHLVLANSRGSTATITVNITGRTYVEFVTQ